MFSMIRAIVRRRQHQCEREHLIGMLAEAQVTIRAARGVPYVPPAELADLIRTGLDRTEFPAGWRPHY